MLPDLHTGFSRGRSGGLVFPSLSEFSTVYCDPHSRRLCIVNKAEIDVFFWNSLAYSIMLSEISQTDRQKLCGLLIYGGKNPELMDIENRLVVARGRGWGMGKMGESVQKEQTLSHKINNA